MIETDDYKGPDRRARRWVFESLPFYIAFAVTVALALTVLNLVAEQDQRHDFDVAVAESNVSACNRVNVIRDNQRWKFRQDARLYRAVASQPGGDNDTDPILLMAAEEMDQRIGRIKHVDCEEVSPDP